MTVKVQRVAVDGWQAPHALAINVSGWIDETIDDDFIKVLREHGDEFQAEVKSAIEIALDRLLEFWRGEKIMPGQAESDRGF